MPDLFSFDYAVIRVVPRVEREEFINVGVIVSCPAKRFLDARIELNEGRLLTLYPSVDIESVRRNLNAVEIICAGGPAAGPIGRLTQRERFHWLVAPRSTIIQPSPVHTGLCDDPKVILEKLICNMVQL